MNYELRQTFTIESLTEEITSENFIDHFSCVLNNTGIWIFRGPASLSKSKCNLRVTRVYCSVKDSAICAKNSPKRT